MIIPPPPTGNPTFLDSSRVQYAPWQAFLALVTPNAQYSQGAYRPAGWNNEEVGNNTFIMDDQGTAWYFDAVIKVDHALSQRITEHPVQTGANISDHSFSLPAQLTFEIGMSDVMDSHEIGQWSGTSKSVSAHLVLKMWKDHGTPLTISTRLDIYENMVVQNLSTPDDKSTLYGLKCLATFKQIFTASMSIQKTNLYVQKITSTDLGNKPVTPLNNASVAAGKNVATFIKGLLF